MRILFNKFKSWYQRKFLGYVSTGVTITEIECTKVIPPLKRNSWSIIFGTPKAGSCEAFIYLEFDDRIHIYTRVYKDDRQVLLYDVEEGGCFDLDNWTDLPKLKQGYYFVTYDFEMEQESYEMPDVIYPVIQDIYFTYCWWGWFYRMYVAMKFFITRTNKYGER